MNDQLKAIENTFFAYAGAFNKLYPTEVAPFFHLPSMLMTSSQVVVMNNSIEVLGVFTVLMDGLRSRNFAKSKIIGDLEIKQLSDNQGQVVGVAKRFDQEDKEIEHFGFTYTLRKVEDKWKIIVGVLHEPEPLPE
ncbi:hypothetical protein [Pseudanabaena sp. PCC 6802]|uniref:DUF6841 family protein n=1 Tax=Pseudanabaena sp. PCC 6802 TaxID=118173 RepID=UPI00034D5B83|nr:hypothetical protein [Pseudanabaena sp. PCC 6802]